MSNIFTEKLSVLNNQLSKTEKVLNGHRKNLESFVNTYKTFKENIESVRETVGYIDEYEKEVKHIKEKIELLNEIYDVIYAS